MILSNHCVITSQCLQLCKHNLHQVCIYLLAITEWVYTFLIPKISPVLGSFSRVYKMKQEDDWNPEAKFELSMALHGPQITPN